VTDTVSAAVALAEPLTRPPGPGALRVVGAVRNAHVIPGRGRGAYGVGMATEPDITPVLRQGLAGYVRAVAAAVDVPVEGATFEVSDTATAYLALACRWPQRPSQDLMLVWDERNGWMVAVETGPAEEPLVVAYLRGDDVVPEPRVVASFVTDVIAGGRANGPSPVFPTAQGRHGLAQRLARYVANPS
jgi:hypothetical protein